MTDPDLDSLREELAEFAQPVRKAATYTPRQERIIAGFEDIERFFETHGRHPQHGEHRDIFERLYAVRLDRIRALEECRSLLEPMDRFGLLSAPAEDTADEEPDLDSLRDELSGLAEGDDITRLRHVRSTEEKRAAEEIAEREVCRDFDRFKKLFSDIERDLKMGVRKSRPFGRETGLQKAEIKAGQAFILGGQIAYVAEVGETIRAPNGETDARLRVIYGNGTESNLLLRSLQRALYKDEAGRWITEPSAGPLFGEAADEDDLESGTIYVLRSKSDHPQITEHRELIHKIGVTGGSVETRIANAARDPTFLLAEVEVVATYQLYNLNRTRLENLLHRVFARARLDLTLTDRFGGNVQPREWFLAPLHVIDEVVERVRDGSIADYEYDPQTATLVKSAT